MQNKKVIIAIILCIAAVISLIYGITARSRKSVTSPASEAISANEINPAIGSIILVERRAAKTDFNSWGPNPFASKKTPTEVNVKLTLSGIIWDEKEPKALINNVVVGTRDKIEGNTVIDIEQDRIILNDGTKDFELRLGPKE